MLNISIRLENRTIKLPALRPGDPGGSITDYGVPGTRLIFFFHPDEETAEVCESKAGVSEEVGFIRVTTPFAGLTSIKKLERNHTFSYPFKSKFGQAWLDLALIQKFDKTK